MYKKTNQKGFTLIEVLIIMTFLAAVTLSIFHFFIPVKQTTQVSSNKTACVNLAQEILNTIKTWEYDEITLENIYKNCTAWQLGQPIPSLESPITEVIVLITKGEKIGSDILITERTIVPEKKATKKIYLIPNTDGLKKLIKVKFIWTESFRDVNKIREVEVIEVFQK